MVRAFRVVPTGRWSEPQVSLLCELCQKPAYIQCTKCRVTYYWFVYYRPPLSFQVKEPVLYYYNDKNYYFSDVEHQKADWVGIHEKICQLLIPLRTAVPFLTSEEDRNRRKAQVLRRQVSACCKCSVVNFLKDFIIFCFGFRNK